MAQLTLFQESPDRSEHLTRKRSHTTGGIDPSSEVKGHLGEEVLGRGRSRSLNEPTKGENYSSVLTVLDVGTMWQNVQTHMDHIIQHCLRSVVTV